MRFLLHHLLSGSALAHPDRTAIIDGTRSTTYAELERASDQLAGMLGATGVTPGDRVGILLDKSIEAVTAIYGALKAGAAYVPLDPDGPVERAVLIAHDCGLKYLVTGISKQSVWSSICERTPLLRHVLVVDGEPSEPRLAHASVAGPDAIRSAPGMTVRRPLIDADVAYILYTSGSTGLPKGVTLSHRNALAFVEWAAEEFAVCADDRVSSHAPFHFDLSIFDLFATGRGAATLVLVPQRASLFPTSVAQFIREQGISIWYSVPSVLTMLTARGGVAQNDFPRLRTVLFAGEIFPTKFLRELMRRVPHVRFANLYGPTETNVCTWYDVPPLLDDSDRPVPIGKAIANDLTYVVTEDGQLARPGEVGELLVRGATVMRGYWGDPGKTDAALVPDPFGTSPHDLVYRTGDLVDIDEHGDLRFHGRRDAQIKSRGHRIELGEIEAALNAHELVAECAAVATPDDLVTNRVVAFVSLHGDTTASELTEACRQRLPEFMVPDRIVILPNLPKTSTDKLDRESLRRRADEAIG